MIDQVNTDQIDEAIDSFEESWSLDSRSQIRSLLGRFHLADDGSAITELIRIDIELRRDGGRLSLTVRDDGGGIEDPGQHGDGMGLLTMRHRARLLGGDLDVRQLQTGGTAVVCSVPYRR